MHRKHPNGVPHKLTAALRAIVAAHGLTHEQAARKVGMSRPRFTGGLNGRVLWTARQWQRFYDTFELNEVIHRCITDALRSEAARIAAKVVALVVWLT